MVSEDIKRINDDKKEIRKNYFRDTNQKSLLEWVDKPAAKGESIHMLNDKTRNEIKEYYIKQIGEENIENSPDYDVELIEVDVQGFINDINFHNSFSKVLIKDLAICFGVYFVCALLGLIFLSMGYVIFALILALIGWGVPLLICFDDFNRYRKEENKVKNSSKSSNQLLQSIGKIKFAPIIAFLLLLITFLIGAFDIIWSIFGLI